MFKFIAELHSLMQKKEKLDALRLKFEQTEGAIDDLFADITRALKIHVAGTLVRINGPSDGVVHKGCFRPTKWTVEMDGYPSVEIQAFMIKDSRVLVYGNNLYTGCTCRCSYEDGQWRFDQVSRGFIPQVTEVANIDELVETILADAMSKISSQLSEK